MGNDALKLPRIYVAAPWADRDKARAVRDLLVAEGFEVTSRWLDLHIGGNNGLSDVSEQQLRNEAMNDIDDVISADVMILLNTQKRGEETSGKAVEFGIAIMSFKGVILVGERTNVFHYLDFPHVDTPEQAIAIAKDYPWKDGQKPERLDETEG